MASFSYELKIPKERIAVLIGVNGEVKSQVEGATSTKLMIDSREGDIFIEGDDALGIYTAKTIVIAIGRGFNPNLAMQLTHVDCVLDQISLADAAKNDNHMLRIKGRIIGSGGKCRKLIEELSEAHLSVYGKTICILGNPESVVTARRAIEMLVKGSPHRNVYKWLESRRRELKKREILGFDAAPGHGTE